MLKETFRFFNAISLIIFSHPGQLCSSFKKHTIMVHLSAVVISNDGVPPNFFLVLKFLDYPSHFLSRKPAFLQGYQYYPSHLTVKILILFVRLWPLFLCWSLACRSNLPNCLFESKMFISKIILFISESDLKMTFFFVTSVSDERQDSKMYVLWMGK